MGFQGYKEYSNREIGILQKKYYNIGMYFIVCFPLSVIFLLQRIKNDWLDKDTKMKEVKCVELYTAYKKKGKYLWDHSWELQQKHVNLKEEKYANLQEWEDEW